MSAANPPFPGPEAFNQFWSDVWSRMGTAGAPIPAMSPEMMNGFRKAFLDAMSASADQLMRSDQFRAILKQSMDSTLAWQQMMNQYMQGSLQQMQIPSRVDSDQIVALVRGMEARLTEKLDTLGARVDRLESGGGKPARAAK